MVLNNCPPWTILFPSKEEPQGRTWGYITKETYRSSTKDTHGTLHPWFLACDHQSLAVYIIDLLCGVPNCAKTTATKVPILEYPSLYELYSIEYDYKQKLLFILNNLDLGS